MEGGLCLGSDKTWYDDDVFGLPNGLKQRAGLYFVQLLLLVVLINGRFVWECFSLDTSVQFLTFIYKSFYIIARE